MESLSGLAEEGLKAAGGVASAEDDSEDLQRLTRWEHAGGLWKVVSRTRRWVTICLCRCDGGEEVERFTTCDSLVLRHLARRARSDE